jgi:hypothetical protein
MLQRFRFSTHEAKSGPTAYRSSTGVLENRFRLTQSVGESSRVWLCDLLPRGGLPSGHAACGSSVRLLAPLVFDEDRPIQRVGGVASEHHHLVCTLARSAGSRSVRHSRRPHRLPCVFVAARSRSTAAAGRHPEHPTAEEGCRPAGWGFALALVTWSQTYERFNDTGAAVVHLLVIHW